MGDSRARRLLRNVEGVAYWAGSRAAPGPPARRPRLPARMLARRLAFPVPGREAHRDGTQPAAGARGRAQPGGGCSR